MFSVSCLLRRKYISIKKIGQASSKLLRTCCFLLLFVFLYVCLFVALFFCFCCCICLLVFVSIVCLLVCFSLFASFSCRIGEIDLCKFLLCLPRLGRRMCANIIMDTKCLVWLDWFYFSNEKNYCSKQHMFCVFLLISCTEVW